MAHDVQVKEIPSQLALTVHAHASMATVAEALGEAFTSIMTAAEATGARYVAPPFALYPAEVTAEFEVVVCMPVIAGSTPSGDVQLEEIPGGTMASTTHHGPYSSLGAAYGDLQAWMVANGKKPSGPCREVYLNEPDKVSPEEILTEIDWPFI
ncbi:MAG: GyrI-like domain-containing protein [Thermoleophilia bacterium]